MIAFLAPGSVDEAILGELVEAPGDGAAGLWVLSAEDGRPQGALQLSLLSRHSRICQLSRLMVAPEARGMGAGTAAVRLACRQAFGVHGIHRIQAEVYGDNLAGRRLFERAGFTREGVKRRAYWRREHWQDGMLYGLLAEEFPAPAVGGSD